MDLSSGVIPAVGATVLFDKVEDPVVAQAIDAREASAG